MYRALAIVVPLAIGVAVASPGAAAADDGRTDRVALEALVSGLGGVIHREWAFGFDAFGVLAAGRFRAALGAPMRLDRTGLRRADWDEPADFGRIVGEVAFGGRGDLVAARLGTIADFTLGTGAVVSGFRSTLDPDHWRTGLSVAIHGGPAGLDAFVGSVIAPSVAGGRLYVRPFDPLQPGGFFGRLELGGSFAGDLSAPRGYVREQASAPGVSGPIRLGPAGLPQTANDGVWAASADLRWPVLKTRDVEVTPHAAYVSLVEASGVHAGLDVAVAPARRFRFGVSGEWRRMWPGYVASYFDALYEVDRYDLGGVPQAALLDRVRSTRSGMMAGAFFEWAGGVRLSARLDLDRDGRTNGVRADAVVDVDRVRATAFAAVKGFRTAADFAEPDRFLAALSVEVRVVQVLTWFATYARDAAVARAGPDRGRYLSSDSALTGLRVGLGW